MGMFAPGTEFGDLMQAAVKIKGTQATEKRKRFESLPLYLQHTLFFGERMVGPAGDEMKQQRLLSFEERRQLAEEYKKEGNKCYAEGRCAEVHVTHCANSRKRNVKIISALFVYVFLPVNKCVPFAEEERVLQMPLYLQHTLFFGERDEMKQQRLLSFGERRQLAEEYKKEGNKCYAEGRCAEAVHQYELAAAMFMWVESSDSEWKNSQRGIDDDVLSVVLAETEGEQLDKIPLRSDRYFELVQSCSAAAGGQQRSMFAPASDSAPAPVPLGTSTTAKPPAALPASQVVQQASHNTSTTTDDHEVEVSLPPTPAAADPFGPRETSGGSSSSSFVPEEKEEKRKDEEEPPPTSACSSAPGHKKGESGAGAASPDQTASAFRETCALNIAAAYLKMQQWVDAQQVCNHILSQNPNSVKALYRRAQSYVGAPGAGLDQLAAALRDLGRGLELQPQSKELRALFQRCREEKQRVKSRQQFAFGERKLFEEGKTTSGTSTSKHKGDPRSSSQRIDLHDEKFDLEAYRDRAGRMSEGDPLERKLQDAVMLRDLYLRNGKLREAQELDRDIELAKRSKADLRKQIDYANPTAQMIADAKAYGLDLTDPMVQSELAKLQEQELSGSGGATRAGRGTAYDGGRGEEAGLGVGGGKRPNKAVPGEGEQWWRYFIFFLVAGIGWRIYTSGILRRLLEGGVNQLMPGGGAASDAIGTSNDGNAWRDEDL